MGLFAQDDASDRAPERMSVTRELGTRRLLLIVVGVIALWFVVNWLNDRRLLAQQWPLLKADPNRLAVVGTLDARGEYDRNLFRIIQSNQTSRVEVTNYGWEMLFPAEKGPLEGDMVSRAIESALKLDNETGYAMLQPYLQRVVARLMRNREFPPITSQTPISVKNTKTGKVSEVPLGDLVERFNNRSTSDTEQSEIGGSSSGREVDHGVTVPGSVLVQACPVVLTAEHFSGADYEQLPENVLQRSAFVVRLYLTPEGRSRFYQWTRDHANESLVFVVGGEVVTAARVRQALNVGDYQITNIPDRETAEKLVAAVKRPGG